LFSGKQQRVHTLLLPTTRHVVTSRTRTRHGHVADIRLLYVNSLQTLCREIGDKRKSRIKKKTVFVMCFAAYRYILMEHVGGLLARCCEWMNELVPVVRTVYRPHAAFLSAIWMRQSPTVGLHSWMAGSSEVWTLQSLAKEARQSAFSCTLSLQYVYRRHVGSRLVCSFTLKFPLKNSHCS